MNAGDELLAAGFSRDELAQIADLFTFLGRVAIINPTEARQALPALLATLEVDWSEGKDVVLGRVLGDLLDAEGA